MAFTLRCYYGSCFPGILEFVAVRGTGDPPLFRWILKVFGVKWQRLTLSHKLRSLGPILGIRVPRWNIFVLFDVAPWSSVPRPRTARRVFSLVGSSGGTVYNNLSFVTYVAIKEIAYTKRAYNLSSEEELEVNDAAYICWGWSMSLRNKGYSRVSR